MDCENKLQCAACLKMYDKSSWSIHERKNHECKTCREKGCYPQNLQTYTCQRCKQQLGGKKKLTPLCLTTLNIITDLNWYAKNVHPEKRTNWKNCRWSWKWAKDVASATVPCTIPNAPWLPAIMEKDVGLEVMVTLQFRNGISSIIWIPILLGGEQHGDARPCSIDCVKQVTSKIKTIQM